MSTVNPGAAIASPRWWPSWAAMCGLGLAAQAGTAGRCFLTPIYLPRSVVISRVTNDITTPGGASTKLRLGLYADNGGTPAGGAVLADSGDLAADSAVVNSFTLTSPIVVNAGYVWGALLTQDATIQFRRLGGAPSLIEVGSEFMEGCHYDRAGSYGALTNPCPAVSANVNANFCTRVRIDTEA